MTTENPFVFGKAVEGTCFADRVEESKRLKANLIHGINTILISPRRWGKTSLVKNVVNELDGSEVTPVFIDIFQCKSTEEFLHAFATAVIKNTSSKFDEWIQIAKTFLSRFSPKFTFGPDPMSDFSISFDWTMTDEAVTDVLNLPEEIARRKGIKIVICLDEFQQIADFGSSLAFQRKMRSVWQHQRCVTYCMFGSKKYLMENIFNDKSMPFFKFGDMIFLKKIPSGEWVRYICGRFSDSGKVISTAQATRICEAVECLSSYVQHLSWIVWYKSGEEVSDADVESSIDDLLEQNKVFFQREVEQLTALQLNFLRAVADGHNSGLTRKVILCNYRLESSATVQAVKKALLKKDIIDVDGKEVDFNDSLFKLWLRRSRFYD